MFDWDGTAVPDRKADATDLRMLVETLCASGCQLAVTSGTHLENVDEQLRARPTGPGRLLVELQSRLGAVGHHAWRPRAAATPRDEAGRG